MTRIASSFAIIAGTLLLSGAAAPAEEWPSRPVRIVSPFSAGGAADILARTVAEHLSTVFKQQFYVENRGGAGGAIGVQAVANSPPDGYSFVVTNVSILVVAPVINPKLAYHPTRDLTNIAYLAGAPVVMAVSPKTGIKSLQDLVARGKSLNRPLTYSSSGIGTNGHLLGESFGKLAGVQVEHIPYKGAALGITDLIAGHIDFGLPVLGSVAPHLRGGTLTGLAQSNGERVPDYPEVPTLKELGYPDLTTTTWFSLSGPAGLPPAIAERVNREVAVMLESPNVKAQLRRDGMIGHAMTIAEFGKLITDETTRWKPVIEDAGLVGKMEN
jgi:tripartite-type tricarboxylate transporter receptor subunit TctC